MSDVSNSCGDEYSDVATGSIAFSCVPSPLPRPLDLPRHLINGDFVLVGLGAIRSCSPSISLACEGDGGAMVVVGAGIVSRCRISPIICNTRVHIFRISVNDCIALSLVKVQRAAEH